VTQNKPSTTPAMGVFDVTLFMVTAGCSLQWVAPAAATGASSLVAWVIGGLTMFLPLAVSVVFLAGRYPDSGGLYAWSRRAFGPFVGFMAGWTYWTGTLAYLPSVLYFSAGSALLALPHGADGATPRYFVVFSISVLALSAILNVRGIRFAKWLNSAGAVARWVGTILLVALAVATWWKFGSATRIDRHTLVPSFRIADVIFWSTLAFAWTGPVGASFMGDEIRDPRRTVPRALLYAAPMIAAIYIVGTASVLVAIPPERATGLYAVVEAFRAAAGNLGVPWLLPVGAACVVLDRIGSMSLWLGALARIPVAAGLEDYLPRRFTRVDPRHRTPVFAILAQTVIIALLVILGQSGTSIRGAYNVLVEMMVVGSMLPFLPLFGSAIRLSAPALAGAVRARPLLVGVAAVGFLTTAASITLAFLPPPEEANPSLAVTKVAGLTAVLLVGGVLAYVAGNARRIARATRG